MHPRTHPRREAAAHVLAMLVAANGRIDERELRVLQERDAFRRLGIDEERFVALAQDCLGDVGAWLCELSWLPAEFENYIDELLDAVDDPLQRQLVCGLAAAVLEADGTISDSERLAYQHTLARWRVDATSEAAAKRTGP